MTQMNVQVMESLTLANEVRNQRAADKKAIFRGELEVASVLRELPSHWYSARVGELLMAMRQVGRHKAQVWCRLERCSLERRLTEMLPRQREMLARHTDSWTIRRDGIRRELENR